MLNSRLIGGILLIVGTSIGGGMLALPVSLAEVGMLNSIYFLIFCWFIMTGGALLILEVSLHCPPGSNMITMAKTTLGLPGQILAWGACLVLLYSLLAAYISGGTDVLNSILEQAHIHLPSWCASILFTVVFGIIVYHGIHLVDYVNRGFMFGKLAIYVLLVFVISPHVQFQQLNHGYLPAITGSLMILITSFGYATIVPSLREYFADDIPSLRRVILYGSLIPLFCYILWMVIIMGVVKREGHGGLMALMTSDHATSGLTVALGEAVNNVWIHGFFQFFTSICIVTALLGVSLSLFDFLADGFKLNKKGRQGLCVVTLTFLPSLVVVLFKPGIYLHALGYAGICCVIFLLLLPVLMAWQGRKKYIAKKDIIILPGGQVSLMLIGAAAIGLLCLAVVM